MTTKREAHARHKQVAAWIAKWRARLLLNEWHVDIYYPECEPPEGGREGFTTLATNSVNVPYLKMQISIYPPFFECDKAAQESAIVHELAHAITQPVWDMVHAIHEGVAFPPHIQTDTLETLTQRVTNVALGRAGA